jgi:hypothetical protein
MPDWTFHQLLSLCHIGVDIPLEAIKVGQLKDHVNEPAENGQVLPHTSRFCLWG